MQILNIKRLYISALTLVLFILVLLGGIAFSTYHSLSSNKENAISAIEKQGDAILDVILVAQKKIFAEKSFLSTEINHNTMVVSIIDDLIRELWGKKIIGFLCIVNETGKVNYHSNPDFKMDVKNLLRAINNKQEKISKYRKLDKGTSVYEIGRRIPSFFYTAKNSDTSQNNSFDYVVLGMEMTEFEAARRADISHSVIMVAILITLACSALFFIYIIRNYYHLNLKLFESRDYIHSVVENMANGLISINRSGNVLACNKPAEIILGIEKKKTNNRIDDLGNFIDLKETGILKTLTDGAPVKNREIDYINPAGEKNTLLLNATPLTESSSTIKGAVIILNDLKEIKLLEEKVRKAENFAVIGKIAASVAHEIRNPLSSIRGFANFFSKKLSGDEKSYEYANIIVEEVDRINKVITELLHYSSSEAINVQKTDLYDLVEQTLLLIEGDINNKEFEVINTIPDDLSMVDIDPDKMKQVILNLLLNAIQVADDEIRIEVGAKITNNNWLYVWVEDNGPGIDLENKAIVFDPFFSLREQGTGLGLSIVQKIIEKHDGNITVKSPAPSNSKGTRFVIMLPIRTN